jgi:hypothetical protein
MIKKGLIITENDRQNILSMYGILLEQEVIPNVKITGKVLDYNRKPIFGATVKFLNNVKTFGGATSDDQGNFILSINDLNEGSYKVKTSIAGEEFNDVDLEIKKNKIEYSLVDIIAVKTKDIEEVKVVAVNVGYTEINLNVTNENNQPVTDYKLIIKNESGKTVFEERIKNLKQFFITQNDKFLSSIERDKDYGPEIFERNDTTYFGKGRVEKLLFVVVVDNVEFKKEFNIFVKNKSLKAESKKNKITGKISGYKIPKNSEILYYNEEFGDNNLNMKITSPYLTIEVKNSNGDPIEGADVNFVNKDIITKTNTEGIATLNKLDINDLIGYIVEKEGYKPSIYKEVKINGLKVIENVKLRGLSEEPELTGEREFKNTLFSIYGKGKSKTSVQEAIRMAKINIVNQYLEKHKKNFGGIPEFTNQDINIPIELAYQRNPSIVERQGGEEYVIYKAKKKDIKNFLKNISIENDIEIIEPLEFENITLKDALRNAFLNGKNVFVLLGKTTEPYTVDTMKKINSSNDASQKISKGYVPIFIPVDTSNENYNYLYTLLSQNRASGQSKIIPRSILFKPLDTVGNKAELIRQIDYTMFKDDINKIV